MQIVNEIPQTFLVTGGAGFIGANYVRLLAEKNRKVKVLDKLTYAGNFENIKRLCDSGKVDFIQGDICDPEIVSSSMRNVDVVVNFAAESHVDNSILKPSDFLRTNIIGTGVLLESSLNNNVKTFLQVSTDEVYGSISSGSWDENFKLEPSSPYSASKASADLLALSYFKTHNLDVRITRCSNNYGPMQHPEKFIPKIIINLLNNKKVPVFGDGTNIREWIYVEDHCHAINKVLKFGESGEIYNIGSDFYLKNIDLVKILLDLLNLDEKLIDFVDDRKGHDLRYSLDSLKIRELGFECKTDFSKGILKTIEWYKKNPNYWTL